MSAYNRKSSKTFCTRRNRRNAVRYCDNYGRRMINDGNGGYYNASEFSNYGKSLIDYTASTLHKFGTTAAMFNGVMYVKTEENKFERFENYENLNTVKAVHSLRLFIPRTSRYLFTGVNLENQFARSTVVDAPSTSRSEYSATQKSLTFDSSEKYTGSVDLKLSDLKPSSSNASVASNSINERKHKYSDRSTMYMLFFDIDKNGYSSVAAEKQLEYDGSDSND
ncbi:hypothetical protein C0J52_17310 [Blattella germanica]|nr:hypothetical protein C0J52_17310 [Blattella germanica]